ncbi:MAG: MFS transporter [Myxococcales bacterium]|nr:MFS transporter [Myxococcales bacterium]
MLRPLGPAPRLALVYAALFGWMGVYLPYWPVWLEDRGMSPPAVGLLLAMAPWTRVVANPIAGRWADRSGRSDRLVQRLAVVLALALAATALAEGLLGLLLAMIGVGLVLAPVIPLTDGLTVTAEAEGRLRYGPVRVWGSVAFIATAWLGGELLEHRGAPVVLWSLVALALALALASRLLPVGAPPPSDAPAESPWSPAFVAALLVAALLHAGHAVLYAFGTRHWLAQGLDEGTVGLLWAESVIAEIILFALAPRLRLTPRALWILAGAAGLVRWSLLSWTVALPWLVFAQALHAFTFGALHLGAMAFIRQRMPPGARARATTTYAAIASGLALGLALPLAGVLYDHLLAGAYWIMAALALLGLLVAVARRDLA